MNKIYAAVLSIPLALVATAAFAYKSTGIVESVDGNQIKLEGGDAFRFPSSVDLSGIKVGQKVQVDWQDQNPEAVDVGRDDVYWLLDATGVKVE